MLKDILLTPENRPQVVRDTARVVDEEVASKSGVTGLAIKGSYKLVQTVRPGLVPEAVDVMLDQFVERMEPFFSAWDDGGKTPAFDAYLNSRASQVANALLGVTDDRAKTIVNSTIKKAYYKLRPQGEKHVIAAIPRLGRTLSRFLPKA